MAGLEMLPRIRYRRNSPHGVRFVYIVGGSPAQHTERKRLDQQESDKLPPVEGGDNSPAPAQPGRVGRQRDALSVFLFGAMLILGLMYVMDERAQTQLEQGASRARQVSLDEVTGQRCQVGSAGVDEQELVVVCPGLTGEQVLSRLGAAKWSLPQGFEALAVRDDAQTTRCVGQSAQWPQAGCQVKALLDREALAASRRRRVKE